MSASGCPCNPFVLNGAGGALLSGSAVVSDNHNELSGGAVLGGSAFVDVAGVVWDGVAGVWGLGEVGTGAAEEYRDSGPYGLHGMGGNAGLYVPIQDSGLFCSTSQSFAGEEFISLPQDTIENTQTFSVSMWIRITEFHQQRVWFSRGFDSPDGSQWVFRLGHTALNNVWAVVQVPDDEDFNERHCAAPESLDDFWWYHVAAVVSLGQYIKVFVDGREKASVSLSETETLAYSSGNYIGRWNDAAQPFGNVQEVRLYPEEKSAEWFRNEYYNFCAGGYWTAGSVEQPILS